MDSVREKVSYLQGLAKGLNFSSQSVEGKLLLNMVDVLDSVAKELQDIQSAQKELENYVDTMDEDLEYLENIIYEEEEASMLHLECPNCNAELAFETTELNAENAVVNCPTCGNNVHARELQQSSAYTKNNHPGI